ncbi:WGR domain-containing protein [Fimbriiglobus ruber]|uniref:WGR domain-containing protein n=1 Tax=Fimbriiglobus ruber TaxID=1908690 RepID=UPI000B4A9EA4|nr:WGR domain-containing protein [Fimbriiglobus ruber]
MENLLTVIFEAHHAALNHHRFYEVTIGRDLLDDWTVVIRYGRDGQGGQEKRFASPDPSVLRAIIRNRLRRRLTAPRRIGCSYRLVGSNAAPDYAAADWFPDDVMKQFGFDVT